MQGNEEQIHSQKSPETPELPVKRPYRLGHSVWWPILAGAVVGILLRFAFAGQNGESFSPMLGSFIYGAPVASAAISTWMCGEDRRAKLSTCMLVGMASACLVVLGALLIAIEGWICAIVIFPLFAVTGLVTGLFMWAIYQIASQIKARRAVYCLASLPLVLGAIEPALVNPKHEYYTTERTIFINAQPNVVWDQVIETPTIEDTWFAKSYSRLMGAPIPLQARSVAIDNNHWVREMRWTKGVHFYGDVNEWQPGKKLAWRYRFVDDSFPAGALDEHVTLKSDYFELIDGSYNLEKKDNGTILTEVTHWRVSTKFNIYARTLGRVLIADTVSSLLEMMKYRSERNVVTNTDNSSLTHLANAR